jgi:hypothetical protein
MVHAALTALQVIELCLGIFLSAVSLWSKRKKEGTTN